MAQTGQEAQEAQPAVAEPRVAAAGVVGRSGSIFSHWWIERGNRSACPDGIPSILRTGSINEFPNFRTPHPARHTCTRA
eukprot:3289666-Prymnesium_polylepis.1